MKKMKFRKIMGCMIAVMMLVTAITVTPAYAIAPRMYLCPQCGGECTFVTVYPSHTKEVVNPGCDHGVHYKATKGTQWVCYSCNAVCWKSITEGHYCEKYDGTNGHYCWDGGCSC